MSQPPYGQSADPYQHPQEAVGGMQPTQSGYGPAPQSGYGTPPPTGYSPPPVGYGASPTGYGAPPAAGYPGAGAPYGGPQPPKSKTGLIIAAVVGVLAIAGVILAVVLVNRVPDPAALIQGDDPVLNQLAQSCFDGDMSACDDLFLQSPSGSAYESYGNTCGGRVAEADVELRYCVDIF